MRFNSKKFHGKPKLIRISGIFQWKSSFIDRRNDYGDALAVLPKKPGTGRELGGGETKEEEPA